MWGFTLPKEVSEAHGDPVRAWGARAIYTEPKYNNVRAKWQKSVSPCSLDIVFDRAGTSGCPTDCAEFKAFSQWVSKIALPKLKKWCDDEWVGTDIARVFVLHDGRYTCLATPNGSYGYMYIGCWEYPATADATWLEVCKKLIKARGGVGTWNACNLDAVQPLTGPKAGEGSTLAAAPCVAIDDKTKE